MTTELATPERLLTVAEATRALNVSASTLRRELAAGHIAGVRVGRQWRVYPEILRPVNTSARGPRSMTGRLR